VRAIFAAGKGKTIALMVAVAAAVVLAVLWLPSTTRHEEEAAAAPAGAIASTRAEIAYPPAFPYGSIGPVSAPSADSVELCGYGPVDPQHIPAGLDAEVGAALLRAIEHLERSASDRERVLALAGRVFLAADNAANLARGDDAPKCFETAGCVQRAREAARRAAVPATQTLARVGVTTRDPQTYAIAHRACQFVGQETIAECSNLRPEQWAQLDPDNAHAWLEVASAAQNRHDDDAIAKAMLRASQAKLINWRAIPYADLLAAVDARSDSIQALLVTKLSMAYFSQPIPQYQVIVTYCAKDKVVEPGRRVACDDLARLMTEHDPTLLGLGVGLGIAERLGWPQERMAELRAERKTLRDVSEIATPAADYLSCKGLAESRQWLQGVTKYGETGYLRGLAAARRQASGASPSAVRP